MQIKANVRHSGGQKRKTDLPVGKKEGTPTRGKTVQSDQEINLVIVSAESGAQEGGPGTRKNSGEEKKTSTNRGGGERRRQTGNKAVRVLYKKEKEEKTSLPYTSKGCNI